MRNFRFNKIWLWLNAFALLGLLTAPALALRCCCTATQPMHCAVQKAPSPTSEPPCHQPKQIANADAPAPPESVRVFVSRACHCAGVFTTPLVIPSDKFSTSFFPVALCLPLSALKPPANGGISKIWPDATESPPRSRSALTLHGRSPPVS